MTTSILIAAIVILSLLLLVSLYFNYKHAILILNFIDEVEVSLDILDQKYSSIGEILEIPLFFDSPQIRDVHENIRDCRDSILKVASIVGRVEEVPEKIQ